MVRLYILLFVSISILSCKNSNKPDVSGIESNVKIIHTASLLKNGPSLEDLKRTIQHDSAFYSLYLEEVLFGRNIPTDTQLALLQQFLQDSLTLDLIAKTESKFGDFGKIKPQLDDMYRHLKYYFPTQMKNEPDIYTFVSQFSYQLFEFKNNDGHDAIAIGLDMFLYPDINYKQIDPNNANFSNYIARSWNEAHLVKKIADVHIMNLLGEPSGHRMLDLMIHNGKAMYFNKLVQPQLNDTIITEYSAQQLDWCGKNEMQIWSFFLDNKLFYESNLTKITKYINPSPNSPQMPAAAPGRTANYIGWQIVKAYMDRFPMTTPQELIDLKDAQLILEKSKYKPKY